jgi:predicted signal transduction protein with EAL and GGDEF domain
MQAQNSSESRTVIKSIVDLGHSLGLLVTAEGVEDLNTLNYLNTLRGAILLRDISLRAPCGAKPPATGWSRGSPYRVDIPDRLHCRLESNTLLAAGGQQFTCISSL